VFRTKESGEASAFVLKWNTDATYPEMGAFRENLISYTVQPISSLVSIADGAIVWSDLPGVLDSSMTAVHWNT
jgi:hypothetical protein